VTVPDNPGSQQLPPNAATVALIDRENLALFVRFVRINPWLEGDSDAMMRAFEVYATMPPTVSSGAES